LTKNKANGEVVLFNESGMDVPLTVEQASHIATVVFETEHCDWSQLEVVFVDEKRIIEINKLHLLGDYVTDIITYHYQDENEPVEGTIFCCAQRIKEQADEYKTTENHEFNRILIHGLLHLCGYDDRNEHDKSEMTAKENEYLEKI
jgi:probable rRNA maturation factor